MVRVLIGDTYRHVPTGESVVVLDLVYRARSGRRRRELTRSVVVRPAIGRTWERLVVGAVDLVTIPAAPPCHRLAFSAAGKGQAA